MIFAFSTLGTAPAEQQFYDLIGQVFGRSNVVWVLIEDHSVVIDANRFTIAWSLESRPMSMPESENSSGLPLNRQELAVWVERWQYCTGEPAKALSEKIGKYARFVAWLFRRAKPTIVLVSSNSIPHTGIPFQLAKASGVPVATFERGYLPGTFQISDYGSGPFSMWSDATLETLIDKLDVPSLEALGHDVIEDLQGFRGNRPSLDPSDRPPVNQIERRLPRILFVPVGDGTSSVYPIDHLDHDRIMPGFIDSEHVARIVQSSGRFDFAVKPHPTDSHLPRWQNVSRWCRVTNGEVIDWIDWANVVVCNGSTLDIAALARGKPVVLAGRSILSNKGMAREARSPSELLKAIDLAVHSGVTIDQQTNLKRFLGWLMSNHLLKPARDSRAECSRRLISELHRCGIVMLDGNPLDDIFLP